ncbi:hypothetical protein EDD21DRAFT_367449 [Dissophora ornata]|nr:hypothetical protein EDD21DRAFT_367449 [Dissophora ornata]
MSTHHLPTRAPPSPPPPTPYIHPAYGHLVRELDFSRLYYIISDMFLTHLFPQTPLLLALTITSPKQFSDDSLLSLSLSCPLLRRLELQGCPKISDKGMEYILEGCQNIHTLVLSNRGGSSSSCSSITDKTLSHLAHSACAQSTLGVLNLSNASPFITGQNPGLLSIALWCPNLVSFNISHCTSFVKDELLANLLCAPSLQVLNLAHCQDITDRGMTNVARGCPDLRELDITAVNLVTDKGVMEIGQRCQSFRKLVMDDRCGRVTEDVLRCFQWGAEVVQRRKMLGWRYSRTF